jgi:hypothetical protein
MSIHNSVNFDFSKENKESPDESAYVEMCKAIIARIRKDASQLENEWGHPELLAITLSSILETHSNMASFICHTFKNMENTPENIQNHKNFHAEMEQLDKKMYALVKGSKACVKTLDMLTTALANDMEHNRR